MDKEQIAIVIGEKIKQYRLANGWTQQELGAKIGISKNAIGNYEKGFRSPKKNTMFDLANAFNVSIDDLFPPIQKDTPPTTSPIQTIYDQLEPPGQRKVITYAEKLRDEQEKRRKAKKSEVSENIIRLDDYRQTTYRRVTGVVSAGSGSMQDDDLDMEVSFYEDEIPDDYDAIAYVVGNSMEPKIKNGDYLFIKNTPQVDYNTIGIFQVDGANYVKKLRQGYLESLNPDYEDIHLDESNDIRTIGEVVSIYREN